MARVGNTVRASPLFPLANPFRGSDRILHDLASRRGLWLTLRLRRITLPALVTPAVISLVLAISFLPRASSQLGIASAFLSLLPPSLLVPVPPKLQQLASAASKVPASARFLRKLHENLAIIAAFQELLSGNIRPVIARFHPHEGVAIRRHEFNGQGRCQQQRRHPQQDRSHPRECQARTRRLGMYSVSRTGGPVVGTRGSKMT
mmetsp:Transcript_57612/g.166794  ORF Transcript_57612/g.166794 Transcript_57612/m.166794 type:complete len:204 (+) Transcript_57612:286-897(+)